MNVWISVSVGGFFRSKDLSGSAWFTMYSPCADILYLSKGPQEIQLGKAGSSLEKKEPKQQVNHAVRACTALHTWLACITQALQWRAWVYRQARQANAGFPGYPGKRRLTQTVHR